jgi:hypothetical protein
VIYGQRAADVFVQKSEGRTGHGSRTSQPGNQTFNELCFSRTEIARERKDISGAKLFGAFTPERNRFFRAI